MLEMTESAAAAIRRAIGRSEDGARGIRVSLIEGGCAGLKFNLELDREARPTDHVIECTGFSVFMDRITGGLIKGTRVDYVESLEGGSFVFQNPQAQSTCVCGKSFTPAGTE